MRVLFTPGMFVDPNYLSVYKIQLVAGRNFSREKSANWNEFIINETYGQGTAQRSARRAVVFADW